MYILKHPVNYPLVNLQLANCGAGKNRIEKHLSETVNFTFDLVSNKNWGWDNRVDKLKKKDVTLLTQICY